MPTPQTFGSSSLGKVIVREIQERMKKILSIDIGYVDAVYVDGSGNSTNYKLRIVVPDKGLTLEDVEIMTNYVDNLAGHFVVPKKGQLCMVGFANGQSEDAFVLGFIRRDYFVNNAETGLIANLEEMPTGVTQNNYTIKTLDKDIIIESTNGAKIRLNKDGSFKLFNKTNHGIEVDASGGMTIRGTSVNFTQSGGTW